MEAGQVAVTESSDRWHRWLLNVRHGGDAGARERDLLDFLYPVRDKVLDAAQLRPEDTVLDVGAGDGLIAFGTFDRLSQAGRVIFSDISADLLDHCRQIAEAEGLLDQCRFVQAAADSLDGIPGESVDVVTTRSVLIYVKDKASAFREFYRVLRPGGRISLFEPINVLMGGYDPDSFCGYDIRPVALLAAKVGALYESIQPLGEDPMGDFDDRDLVRYAEDAGFPVVDLEMRLTVKHSKQPVPWDRFLRTSGNPLIPPFGEAFDRTLSPDEKDEFTAHLRPLVESGTGQDRTALAYLTAAKAP
jgi:arsenite methyltransferase